jgi:nucleoid DNA-binding protein
MKSKQLMAKIAAACNLRPETATTVVDEVFRQIRTALEGGERVEIDGFGIFISREVSAAPGEPAKRVVRFRSPPDEATKREKALRRQERAGKQEDQADEDDD